MNLKTTLKTFENVGAVGEIEPHKLQRLEAELAPIELALVAFSGGVDSAVVAAAAVRVLSAERVRVVMAVGPAVASGEVETATRVAAALGLSLITIDAGETRDPQYVQNDSRRCFHCKTNLYRTLTDYAASFTNATLLNGTNADDLSDYRPGLEAARDWQVASPLATAGLTKSDVRVLAREFGLEVHDKPATPCLASRIAYGESVTVERLSMVDRAESLLRAMGLKELRVRYHSGDVARIEVPVESLGLLIAAETRTKLVHELRALGFRFITLDLAGFQSGSLNQLVSDQAASSEPLNLFQIGVG